MQLRMSQMMACHRNLYTSDSFLHHPKAPTDRAKKNCALTCPICILRKSFNKFGWILSNNLEDRIMDGQTDGVAKIITILLNTF